VNGDHKCTTQKLTISKVGLWGSASV